MSLVDHDGGAEYPYARDDVFQAVLRGVKSLSGMQAHTSDPLGGRIVVKTGVSFRSWGENIPVSVTEVAPGRTRVAITSTPKTGIMFGGAVDFGKNRGNIEKILAATSQALKHVKPVQQITPAAEGQSPAERLARLEELRRGGLITDSEYSERRQAVLASL